MMNFLAMTGGQRALDMKKYWAEAYPQGDVAYQQEHLHSHYQAVKMKGWRGTPIGIALWFTLNGGEEEDRGLFVQDAFYRRPKPPENTKEGEPVFTSAGTVAMMYTRVDHMTNRIFRHREYSAGKNNDWLLRLTQVAHGMFVEARHRIYGAV